MTSSKTTAERSGGLELQPPGTARNQDELKQFDEFQALVPLGQRKGRPEEVAAGFKFLFSKDAGFVNGITLFVDGGHDTTLRPGVREFSA